jgi:uroporphyrinogen-III synthase
MTAAEDQVNQGPIPILLLKTKSTPEDAYEELFSVAHDSLVFEPHFVPVLEHRFKSDGLDRVKELLVAQGINNKPGSSYGGLIFTSQRAVEAFAAVVDAGKGLPSALDISSSISSSLIHDTT